MKQETPSLWTDQEPPESVQPEKVTKHEDLIRWWPWIRDRLEIIKKKDPTHGGHWLPEHIRHAAMLGISGQSTCEVFVAREEDALYAFIITEIIIDRYVHVPMDLHVWAGWLNKSMCHRFLPFIDNLARARGVTRITFQSGRFAWKGTIEALAEGGFSPDSVTYAREVR